MLKLKINLEVNSIFHVLEINLDVNPIIHVSSNDRVVHLLDKGGFEQSIGVKLVRNS